MTIDEAIKTEEDIAEENQRVVDTGIVFDNVTIDMLYCDDTEVIEEHLANYQRCANEHRQLAEWLKDYKRLLEQEPVCDRLAREYISKIKCCDECFLSTFCTINDLRESREPKYYCIENIKKYFESKSEGKE